MSGLPDGAVPIRATYRLQFHRGFTFRDATELVPYLADLGVSHIYASPVMEARPGSTHGYDIVNHNRLNPDIGSEEDFRAFVDALHRRDMGLILDFVPNHMAVGGPDNAWWLDVLEWGRLSPFAEYFDINWDAVRPDLKGRVLLPVLGEQYGVVLENGEIELRFDAQEGSFSAWYFEHRLPISPRTYPSILAAGGEVLAEFAADFRMLPRRPAEVARQRAAELKQRLAQRGRESAVANAIAGALHRLAGRKGHPASFLPLHRLLEAQAYRVADWRVAAEEINYRRFFNINDLAGLRMDVPRVFDATHLLVGELIRRGDVQGLRIDHIDGLYDPQAYCERLQRAFGPLYVLVEKILAPYERLPDWPIAGTTGYDFINQVLGLFVDPEGERATTQWYRRLARRGETFDEVLYAAKKRIMQVNLASEMNVLAREFHGLAMQDWRTRDFTLSGMLAALEEVVAGFPVYRTYVSSRGAGPDALRYLEWALAQAKKRWRANDTSIFDFIQGVFSGHPGDGRLHLPPDETLRVAMHFQQVTGPVMAKACEDTAFYRFVRLLALNEVGGDPRRFGMSLAAFHHVTQDRSRIWPQTMVTTATHDTKRGEDARVRLALLSELPREWGQQIARWRRLNRSRRVDVDDEIVPDRNTEYLFYQALFGAWPPGLAPDDLTGMQALAERLDAYMIKAVREAKEKTSWSNPNAAYEAGVQRFVRGALDASRSNPFLAEFHGFARSLIRLGTVTSLSQLVLKLTVPGVPDIYQGGELWDFSLVDPDNRRAVDWPERRALVAAITAASAAELGEHWLDGREKLFVIHRLLGLRRSYPKLFADGDYRPLEVEGAGSDHLCAFIRSWEAHALLIAVPRLVYRLYRDGTPNWGAARLALPAGAWRDAFTGRRVDGDLAVPVSGLLADFPVAALMRENGA
ncbi:MAG TPA: malto-oligosyltrehalose synthase [Stellaceae bacterium]|nr:malto-oligosyltrehalose synthase [Stellaceae bacterium]